MPLITSWATAGNPVLTDQSKDRRTYRVGEANDYIDYLEVVERKSETWNGCSEAFASDEVDANTQPGTSTNETYSWTMNEENRQIKSYALTRDYEKKTTSVTGTTPVPTIAAVTFSAAENLNLALNAFPISLTLSHPDTRAKIKYRVDSVNSFGQSVVGAWNEISSSSGTVSVNTTEKASGKLTIDGNKIHKFAQVHAYAYITLLTGTYTGPQGSRRYAVRAPNLTWTISPIQGRNPTDIGHYLDTGTSEGSVVLNFANSGPPGTSLYYKVYFAESDTKNPNTAGKNKVDWTQFDILPFSPATSSWGTTLQKNNGTNGAIFTGSSRDNSGFRYILRALMYAEITFDGVYYFSGFVDKIFYADNDPF